MAYQLHCTEAVVCVLMLHIIFITDAPNAILLVIIQLVVDIQCSISKQVPSIMLLIVCEKHP